MAKLYFDIGANYSEAERLTKVCKTLEERITSLQGSADPTQIQAWTLQLAAAQKRLSSIAIDAAKAGKAFQDIDVEELQKSFDTVAQDPKVIKNLEKGLKNVAKAYESELKQAQKRMEQFGRDANKAMKKGDAQGYDTATKGIAAEQEKMTMLGENISSVNDALKILGGEANKDTGIIERLLGGTENYNKAIKEMPASMRKATVATNGLTKGMKAFMAVPIVAVISAIALAFAAFKKWLNSTEEGEMLLAKATGVLKGVMVTLENIAVRVGQALYDAFSNPKETIAALGKAIQEDIIDRFTPLKDKVSSIIKFFKTSLSKEGGVKKAVNDLVDEWTAANEIKEQNRQERREKRQERRDNRKEQVRKFINEAKNNITESQQIELDRLQLSKDKSDWEVKSERNEAKMVQLQDIYQNSSLNSDIRGRALEAYMKILKEQTSGDEGIASREADLIRREQALSVGGTSAEAATLNSAYANLEKVRAKGERQMKAANKAMFSIIKEGEKEGEAMQRMSLDEWEAELNLQEDSTQKKLDLLWITYQRDLENIAQQAETWRNANGDLLSDEERELVRSLFPDISDEEFEKTFGGLTVAQAAAIDKMGIIAVKNLKKGREDIGKAVYESYKSEEDQKKDLEKAYLEDVAALETAYKETGDEKFKRSIEERTKAYKNALYELDKANGGLSPLIFANSESLSDTLLTDAITATTEAINKCDPNNVEALTELYDKLHKFQSDQISRSDFGFSAIFKGINDLNGDELKNLENAYKTETDPKKQKELFQNYLNNLSEAQQRIIKGFSDIGSAFSEMGSTLEQFDGVLGDIGKTLSALGSQSDILGKAFSGTMSKTEAIGAGISGVIQLGSMALTSIQNNKKAQEEWNNSIAECEQKYRMLALEALDYKQRNIFGIENPYKQAIDGAYQYGKAMEELRGQMANLNNGQVQTGTKKVVDWSNVGKGAAIGAGAGAAVGAGIFSAATAGIGAAIGAAVGAITGLLSAKTVPVLESLSSVYGELFDPNTYKLNDRILADYAKLDEDTKKVVDNWEEIREKALEAEQQMKDTFATLSGDVGKQLSDSLVDAFRNNDLYSAIDNFHNHMTGTIEDIIEQMIFSTVFGDMFDELEKRMDESFRGPNADNDITDDLIWMENEYQNRLEIFDMYMRQAKDSLSGQGYDAWAAEIDKQTATGGGGFQVMSQDTGTELNGRFTALQISGENIDMGINTIVENFSLFAERFASQLVAIDDIRNIQAQSLLELQGINENTLLALKPIREMNTTLGEIKTKVDRL